MPRSPIAPKPPADHADYLARVPEPQRSALQKLRQQIRKAVPEATEGFSYGLPAFRVQNQPLAAFNATRTHCGFYPMSGSIVAQFANQLEGFETSKGTIRFQPDHPIPLALLKKILAARIAELSQASARLPAAPRARRNKAG